MEQSRTENSECTHMRVCVSHSVVSFFGDPCQAPLSMEFSRQEYWSGLSFPSPADLPNPEIYTGSPALQVDTLPREPPGEPIHRRQNSSFVKGPWQFDVRKDNFFLPNGAGITGSISHGFSTGSIFRNEG